MKPKLIESMRGTPPPKSTEEAWKEHYRLQEQYIDELENRLRALWDKYEGDRKHYMDRIKRLEEQLIHSKNKYAVLVADVALYEDRGERIKRLEEAGDRMRLYCADPDDRFAWDKAKEAKL